MKTKIALLYIAFFGIVTHVFSQVTPTDTTKKDTTLGQKLGKAVQAVGNYVLPPKEEDEDEVCYSDRCVFEEKMATGNYGIGQFTHETFLYFGAPARWHKKNFLEAGLIIAGTLALWPFDESLNKLSQGYQRYYYSAPIVGGRIY